MPISAKICGLRTLAHAELAATHGAAMLGFVHFPRSPRHLAPAEVAPIASAVRAAYPTIKLASILVDPSDALIDEIMAAWAPDYLQLHGKETPARTEELRRRAGIIKAVSVASAEDLTALPAFDGIADFLLLDAKPRADDILPGGNGHAFDWTILSALPALSTPWMLSGGLTPANLPAALAASSAEWVDVSSGVEYPNRPGEKDPDAIVAFLNAARRF